MKVPIKSKFIHLTCDLRWQKNKVSYPFQSSHQCSSSFMLASYTRMNANKESKLHCKLKPICSSQERKFKVCLNLKIINIFPKTWFFFSFHFSPLRGEITKIQTISSDCTRALHYEYYRTELPIISCPKNTHLFHEFIL